MARLKRRLKLNGVYEVMYLFLHGDIDEVELKTAINESTQSAYFDVDDRIKDGYIGVYIDQNQYLEIMGVDNYNQSLINNIGNNYEDDQYQIGLDLIDGYIFSYFNKKDFEKLQEYFKLFDRGALAVVNQILNGNDDNNILGELGKHVNKLHAKLTDIIVEEYQIYHEMAVEAAGGEAIKIEMCDWLSQIPTAVWAEDGCPEYFYMKISEILNQYRKYFTGKYEETPIINILKSYDLNTSCDLGYFYYESGLDEDKFSGFHHDFQYRVDDLIDVFLSDNDNEVNIIEKLYEKLRNNKLELQKKYELPGGRYYLIILDLVPEEKKFKIQINDTIKNTTKKGVLDIERINTLIHNLNFVDTAKDTHGFDLISEIKQLFLKILS